MSQPEQLTLNVHQGCDHQPTELFIVSHPDLPTIFGLGRDALAYQKLKRAQRKVEMHIERTGDPRWHVVRYRLDGVVR